MRIHKICQSFSKGWLWRMSNFSLIFKMKTFCTKPDFTFSFGPNPHKFLYRRGTINKLLFWIELSNQGFNPPLKQYQLKMLNRIDLIQLFQGMKLSSQNSTWSTNSVCFKNIENRCQKSKNGKQMLPSQGGPIQTDITNHISLTLIWVQIKTFCWPIFP